MPNLLSTSIDWLNTQLSTHASTAIAYKRGQIELSVDAVRGSSEMALEGEPDVVVRTDDFIIRSTDLNSLADVTGGAEPREGDLVIVGEAVYRVSNWRNSDAYGVRYRVHTTRIDG